MPIYLRDLQARCQALAGRFPVLTLTGARQAGKTTLLRAAFPEHAYVSLDLPSLAEEAERAPESLLARFPPPVLIDEVQYAPSLFRHVKVAVDAHRHRMGHFILTGSQKLALMGGVSESLAGRAAVLELETLSLSEIAQRRVFPADTRRLRKVIVRGGFPGLWRDPRLPAEVFYASYLATYLERDVRQILNVASLRDFERFVRACAARNAQLLDKTALATEIGVSLTAVTSWLSVLEASNQVVLLEPWFANFGKRIVKTPKLYFCDTGLASFLLGVTEDTFAGSPFAGPLFETLVFAELRKSLARSGAPHSLWFYRDNQAREVDFVLLRGGRASLFEAKWSELPGVRDAKAMRELLELTAARRVPDFASGEGFVVCRSPSPHPLGASLSAISLRELGEKLPGPTALLERRPVRRKKRRRS